jgi:hypothetical protein
MVAESNSVSQVLWPIVIVQDRYRGTYTGGEWVAIGQADYFLGASTLEDTVWGDDASCMEWAHRNIHQLKQVGIGDTPEKALEDLITVTENVKRRRNPEDEVVRLRDAIMAHRALVMADPASTEKAEEELWSVLKPL